MYDTNYRTSLSLDNTTIRSNTNIINMMIFNTFIINVTIGAVNDADILTSDATISTTVNK
jgi:hypothetical protein